MLAAALPQRVWLIVPRSPRLSFKNQQGQYHARGFTEVISPNMFDVKLWKTSGHWQHYRDDMFAVVDPKNDKCVCGSGAQADEGVAEVSTSLLNILLKTAPSPRCFLSSWTCSSASSGDCWFLLDCS